jgi:hypothetical protein
MAEKQIVNILIPTECTGKIVCTSIITNTATFRNFAFMRDKFYVRLDKICAYEISFSKI